MIFSNTLSKYEKARYIVVYLSLYIVYNLYTMYTALSEFTLFIS